MNKEERKDKILDLVANNSDETIENLAELLNVSEMTIRRDLHTLENEDIIIKTRNSILLKNSFTSEIPFIAKQYTNINEKKEIARKAISLIMPDEIILLDSGTTTLEICKLLKQVDFTVTVITNDIKAAAELIDTGHKVIILGGEVQRNIGSIYGTHTIEFLENIKVNQCFVGAAAVVANEGVFSPNFEKAKVKSMMIKAAKKKWLVVDKSKFNSTAFVKVCDINDLSGVITNDDLSEKERNNLASLITVI